MKENKPMIYLLQTVAVFCFSLGCSNYQGNSQTPMTTEKDALANTLTELGYSELFHRATYEQLEEIWDAPENPGKLKALVANEEAEMLPRLLAAEIVFQQDEAAWAKFDPAHLSQIYVAALQGSAGSPSDFAIYGNSWGFMAYLESQDIDGTGPLGKRLVRIGKPAIAPLAALLEDENVLMYEGSKEATVGNSLRLRVKDAAAYFIAMIQSEKVKYEEAHSARDEAISALKKRLEE